MKPTQTDADRHVAAKTFPFEPKGEAAMTSHRGVRAEVVIKDDPDHEGYVVIELHVAPAPTGLDKLAYTRHQKAPS